MSDDGTQGLTIIAFLGSVFSPYYAHARHAGERRDGARGVDLAAPRSAAPAAFRGADPLDHCAINVALYGRDGARWAMTERGRGAVVRDATRLTIGPSGLEWDGDTLRLHLDEVAAPLPRRIRGTISVALGARPEHRVALDANSRHTWGVIAPCARIDVALAAPRLAWSGSAYVDSNRGSVPLEHDFVRWDWSRAHLADGRSAVVYDVERRDGPPLAVADAFDARGGVTAFVAPPLAALPRTRWGIDRSARCDLDATPRVASSFESGPFYTRSVVETRWCGQPVTAVHEHLSLDRFEQRWVRALLPFRMPRRIF